MSRSSARVSRSPYLALQVMTRSTGASWAAGAWADQRRPITGPSTQARPRTGSQAQRRRPSGTDSRSSAPGTAQSAWGR